MIVSAILLLVLLKPRKELGGREDTGVKENIKIGTILQIHLADLVWKRHRYFFKEQQPFSEKVECGNNARGISLSLVAAVKGYTHMLDEIRLQPSSCCSLFAGPGWRWPPRSLACDGGGFGKKGSWGQPGR